MISKSQENIIKIGLPKGRMEQGVFKLLEEAGVHLKAGSRTYRPLVSLAGFEAKILKPQDIVTMLHIGSRDIGFAGADWVFEMSASLVELVDTELDPVELVAAAPEALLTNGKLPKQHLYIASEYEILSKNWINSKKLDATFVHCHGATEVFPPEDADCIVDNTSSGATLKANNLVILDVLMKSSTRLYANPKSLDDPQKLKNIEHLVLLIRSVLEARKRVMLEVNVSKEKLEELCNILPSMREPTIAPLHGMSGFALKVAVPKKDVPSLVPKIKEHGGTDIVITPLSQIVP